MSKRNLTIWLLICLLLLPVSAPAESSASLAGKTPVLVDRIRGNTDQSFSFAPDADLVEVYFPQIYDCDAALIRSGDATLLIDCCIDALAPRLLLMLDKLGVTSLDAVLITHPHRDHMGGLELVCAHMPVGMILNCFPPDTNDHMNSIMETAAFYRIPVREFRDGDVITVGKARLDIYLKADRDWRVNERSAVMRLICGERTLLFTADIEGRTPQRLVDTIPADKLRSDILRMPHHSNGVLPKAFYDAVQPSLAIITTNDRVTNGKKDLNRYHIPWYLTMPGFLACVTDGHTWTVERIFQKEAVPRNEKLY